MTRPTAATGQFPYAHPTLEDIGTIRSLSENGSPETATRFRVFAIRDAIEAVRPARKALSRQANPNHLTILPVPSGEAAPFSPKDGAAISSQVPA